MDNDLVEAISFHERVVKEGRKALVGYEREKLVTNVALLSEIPTTQSEEEDRQVNSANILLEGVPGVGKTFFGVIIAAISDASFARIQGRYDLQPSEIIGFQRINPVTGEIMVEQGPIMAEVVLLDEINRTPPKSQSAYLEALQDRTVTIGNKVYNLPKFNFSIATMNPVELGQGTSHLSEAAQDRFAIKINIKYLSPEEEQKLVQFDFKKVKLDKVVSKERIVELRSAIARGIYLNPKLDKYIRRLVGAGRPFNREDWPYYSPSPLVEKWVALGPSPRTTICWGRLAKAWALLYGKRNYILPEDIQNLAPYVLGHRIWLKPEADGEKIEVGTVIKDILERVAIP